MAAGPASDTRLAAPGRIGFSRGRAGDVSWETRATRPGEAGARRRTPAGDAPGFGAAKNLFVDRDAADWAWDEWDLTLPKHAAPTKRGAIRAFYDAYYAACAELQREFPANVRSYDCEALFESEKEQRDLFAWLGIRGDPPRERVCENQQRYLYLAPEGDDDDFDALTRANVASFNGAAATVDAHTAHPLRCGDSPFYDCRHFCQPGPLDQWNAQLIRLLLSWNETEGTEPPHL